MKYMILLSGILISASLNAQQDPEAKKILDDAAEKTNTLKTIQADFVLNIIDRKENSNNETSGKVKIKGDKYQMQSMGTTVFFDGKTMWTYVKEIEEVTITEPDMNDEDFLSNPAKIVSMYNRDFKYRYVNKVTQNRKEMHEIDLFPKNLEQPYTRIKLFIGVDDLLLYKLNSMGKDGINYEISINNYVIDNVLDDQIFVFDPTKYKKAEIIDMRSTH